MITFERVPIQNGLWNVTIVGEVNSGKKAILRVVKRISRCTPEQGRDYMRLAAKQIIVETITRYCNQREKALQNGRQFVHTDQMALNNIRKNIIDPAQSVNVSTILKQVVKYQRDLTWLLPSDNSKFKAWTYIIPELINWAKINQE